MPDPIISRSASDMTREEIIKEIEALRARRAVAREQSRTRKASSGTPRHTRKTREAAGDPAFDEFLDGFMAEATEQSEGDAVASLLEQEAAIPDNHEGREAEA